MKRRRAWIWVLATLGAILLVAGVIVWDAHRKADEVFERSRKETEAWLAEVRSRSLARPPLEGEGNAGNAWSLYQNWVPRLANLAPNEAEAIPEVDGTWTMDRLPDDEIIGVLYLKYAPEIDGLRQAAQRREVDSAHRYEDGSAMDVKLLPMAYPVVNFLCGGITHYHRMGKGKDALGLATLGLHVSGDLCVGVGLIGRLTRRTIDARIAYNLLYMLAAHRFAAEDLERFADVLDRRAAESSDFLMIEEFLDRIALYRDTTSDDWRNFKVDGLTPGWRQLYSWKIVRAQAVAALPACFREMKRALSLPFPERSPEIERLAKIWRADPNPFLRSTLGMTAGLMVRDAFNELIMRLLRVAVALAWHEAEKGVHPAALADLTPRYIKAVPTCSVTGNPFSYTEGRLWAAGKDGVDNGGKENPEDPLDLYESGVDVVVRVGRRK